MSLAELGIGREALQERMYKLIENAENEATTVVHPRVPSTGELEDLFTYAYEGQEIDF